ncbi:MAG TPA: rhodanese-related sulfurtransferase [Candidatus Kapabacteria bacterium]|nr:rhodanese-related sulfurtransferase [Candidatus Kapabacteria bacterium]
MKKSRKYILLTFYKFVDLENAQQIADEHKSFCSDIGLMGRIFIGEEGISATVSGLPGQIEAYKLYLQTKEYFKDIPDIDIKATIVEAHQFDKLIVRYRKEIVALGETYKASDIKKYEYRMNIDDFKSIIDQGNDDYVILDMRNDYEYELGHFKGAVPAGTFHFKQLSGIIDRYKEEYGNKKIVMYCTGGIRCEKASVMLEKAGLPGVFQLDGGVVKYVNTFNDGNWLGNLYTFDGRISTEVGDSQTHTVISSCHYTGEPAEAFFNCRYSPCNYHFIAKPEEYKNHFGFCCEECFNKAKDDLYIRNDFDIDPLNYKELRGNIKSKPEIRADIKEMINLHLNKMTKGLQFKVKECKKVNFY